MTLAISYSLALVILGMTLYLSDVFIDREDSRTYSIVSRVLVLDKQVFI
jgi:hypothetical protein